MDFNYSQWVIDHPNQSSLDDSLHNPGGNPLQTSPLRLDRHPIDPRLETRDLLTTTQSNSNHTLDLAHSQFLSHLTPQPLSPVLQCRIKRAKLNFANQKDMDDPSFEFRTAPFQNQAHWKGLEIDDQIQALMGGSTTPQLYSHGRNPQDLMISKHDATTSIWLGQATKNTYDDPLDPSIQQQTPSPSISTSLLDTANHRNHTPPSDHLSKILVHHQHAPPSSSIAEPTIAPSLEILHPTLSIASFAFSPSSSYERAPYSECIVKDTQPNISRSILHSPSPQFSTHSTSSLKLSQVDVHGAGAGGGAAAVLEAVAAQQALKYPSTFTVNWNNDPLVKAKKQIRKRPTSKPNDQQDESNIHNKFDLKLTPMPTSYNPDQFRSWNRIHWTKEEEQLLLKEVELHWHHYDCMAQIMKRHGPKGTISKTFAGRTGVSLKDKAVNISSRWYRDGSEISPTRRRAFARFRPKQLRGKPKNELPGMNEFSNFLDPSKLSSTPLEHPQHPN